MHHRQPKREERRKRGAQIDPPGFDAGKKIKGKKRHILVDSLGLLIHALIHPADIQDRDGGVLVMSTMFGMFPFLKKLFADAGYQGPIFRKGVKKFCLTCPPKLSSDPIRQWDLKFCQNGGLSNELLLGSIVAAALPRIGKL